MVGVAIITFAFVSLASVFTAIPRAILVNKTKTIAINLAQEKIEALKNLSYYRLLVSTAAAYWDSNFPTMRYDMGTTQSYYPEETLNVGERKFKRRTYVEFLKLLLEATRFEQAQSDISRRLAQVMLLLWIN